MSKSKKLTSRQEQFCQEYLIDLNGTQAAIRAGYSEKTANEIASENLAKPNIQARVAELKAKRLKRVENEQDSVLKELLNWFYSDVTEFMQLKPEDVKKLDPSLRRLITGFKNVQKTTKDDDGNVVVEDLIELRFVSKEKAAEFITKHIGFYELDNLQQKQDTAPRITIESKKGKIDLSL